MTSMDASGFDGHRAAWRPWIISCFLRAIACDLVAVLAVVLVGRTVLRIAVIGNMPIGSRDAVVDVDADVDCVRVCCALRMGR